MSNVRISIRNPAKGTYNGTIDQSPARRAIILRIWWFLTEVQQGKITISVAPGKTTILDGKCVYLVMGRPKPNDPDATCDLFLSHIIWPEEVD